MRTLLSFAACGAAILLSGVAYAEPSAPPLVDADWVAANSCQAGVVTLDVRNPISGGDLTAYMKGHIPCAVYSNYAQDGLWRKKVGDAPGLVPPVNDLEKLIGSLGIDNDTHVVIYTAGTSATDMGSATRVFWTLKYLGDDNVSILDGGYAGYVGSGAKPVHSVQVGFNKPTPKTFHAQVRPELLASKQDVEQAIQEHSTLVDDRPSSQYLGINRVPVVARNGTIPTARSLPESWITANDGGTFRSATQLKALYTKANVPTSGKQINFCNTGHWASLGWFASYELLGNKQAKLYAGSMSEWSHDPKLEVEQEVK
jgi:thiosulfate/3-mercaptopyruvate sulfurtransferase